MFWSLAGVKIQREEFRAELHRLGLDEAMSRDPSPKGALSKAVPAVVTGKRGVLARRVTNGSFGLLLERLKEEHRLEITHVATVGTKGGDLEISFVGEAEHERLQKEQPGLLSQLASEYSLVRDYVQTADLSEVLSAAMNGSPYRGLFSALSLRERTGGLYFIHGSHVERMQQFAATIQRLAPECQVSVLTITGDRENLEQTAAAARTTFASQLKALKAELVEFRDHLSATQKAPSEHSIAVRAERYRELLARVELFKDILGDVAGDLSSQISEARDQMLAQLEAL